MKSTYTLPAVADFHVHLRSGTLSRTVVPTIRAGGVNTVYVMPNLTPPITTVSDALAYRAELQALDPTTTYLMTLYLHPSVTPAVIREAAATGGAIAGVKSYPAGVTTNSASGVLDYEAFFPVFEAMQETGMVLNLHGECPSDQGSGITVLNAEERFLPTLRMIHHKFPRLKMVLEHCTTAAAVKAVMECGDSVRATLTAHHLFLVVDDWAGDTLNFCKPVAKLPSDRLALLNALVTSGGKFFFGTDSAPHPLTSKKPLGLSKSAAGVFTQPYAVSYVLTALEEAVARGDLAEEAVTQEVLEGFLGRWGRDFYGVEGSDKGETIVMIKTQAEGAEVVVAAESIDGEEGLKVVPFRPGKPVWTCEWKKP